MQTNVKPAPRVVDFDIALDTHIKPKTMSDKVCLLYTSPSPRDRQKSRMPSSA